MFWVLRNLVYCRYTRCIREFAFGVSTPVELLQPFESGCIVGLQEAGWTYRWIAAHVGHTVSRLCVAAFSSGLWNIPTPLDQVLDGRMVQMLVKIDTLCEQQWLPKQLLCHEGPLETICLQQDSDHMCIWPDYHLHHDIGKHGYSGILTESTGEWNGALLSSVIRVGSVCMWVMDVHVYIVDLMSIIFQSAFAHDTQALPQASCYGGTPVTTRGHIWCSCRV